MTPEKMAERITAADKQAILDNLRTINQRESQDAVFSIWQKYIPEPLALSCGKCRSRLIHTIRMTTKHF